MSLRRTAQPPKRDDATVAALRSGRIQFGTPERRGPDGRWMLTITDTETGESVEKAFFSEQRAIDFVASQLVDADVPAPVKRPAETAPRESTGCAFLDEAPEAPTALELAVASKRATQQAIEKGQELSIGQGLARRAGLRTSVELEDAVHALNQNQITNQGRNPNTPIKLSAVKKVLESYGLDPSVELVNILQKRERVPQTDDKGRVLRDEDGRVVYRKDENGDDLLMPVIPMATRVEILKDFQDRVSPKLKAVEVRINDDRNLTPEQVEARIVQLMAVKDGEVRA